MRVSNSQPAPRLTFFVLVQSRYARQIRWVPWDFEQASSGRASRQLHHKLGLHLATRVRDCLDSRQSARAVEVHKSQWVLGFLLGKLYEQIARQNTTVIEESGRPGKARIDRVNT
jgi:hypothetical protein